MLYFESHDLVTFSFYSFLIFFSLTLKLRGCNMTILALHINEC